MPYKKYKILKKEYILPNNYQILFPQIKPHHKYHFPCIPLAGLPKTKTHNHSLE